MLKVPIMENLISFNSMKRCNFLILSLQIVLHDLESLCHYPDASGSSHHTALTLKSTMKALGHLQGKQKGKASPPQTRRRCWCCRLPCAAEGKGATAQLRADKKGPSYRSHSPFTWRFASPVSASSAQFSGISCYPGHGRRQGEVLPWPASA